MPISITNSTAQSNTDPDLSTESMDYSEIRGYSPISRQNVQSNSPPIALSYPITSNPPKETPPGSCRVDNQRKLSLTKTVRPNNDEFQCDDDLNDGFEVDAECIGEEEAGLVVLEQGLDLSVNDDDDDGLVVLDEEEEEEDGEHGMEYVDYPEDLNN